VHQVRVGNVAVGEDHLPDSPGRNDFRKLFLRMDGNSPRIQGAGQFRREDAVLDPGNLGCGEGDDFNGGIVPEADLKIMKVPPGSAHDEDLSPVHTCLQKNFCGDTDEY
jgi:hypothetical protein